jgi:hypothetical protein
MVNLAEKVADMSATCRHNSQMSAHFAQMPLSWQHNYDPDTFVVSEFADIHPFLLRVPEVHAENSTVSSDMRVTVGVAKRYLVSDNYCLPTRGTSFHEAYRSDLAYPVT